MDTGQSEETFAHVLTQLMAEYEVNASDVARAIDGSPSTVSFWLSGKKAPLAKTIAKLSEAFPKYSKERLGAAAGRKMLPPLGEDSKERLLAVFDRLTEEQREMMEIQARALADSNGNQV